MLCSSTVAETAVVCPLCGGAVEDATEVQGIDLTKVADDAPEPASGEWPPSGHEAPGGYEPPPGYGAPPGYGPPPGYGYGPPPAYGPAPGYGAPPGYPPSLGPASPAGYGYGGWPGYVAPSPTEGMALAAVLTSVIGLAATPAVLVSILACPVGAILGHVALRRIAENGKGGRGMALTGIVVGWIGTALVVLGIAVVVALVVAATSGSA